MQREVDREGLGQDHDEQQPAIVRQCVYRVFLVVQVEALGRESPIQRDFQKPLGMPKRPTGTGRRRSPARRCRICPTCPPSASARPRAFRRGGLLVGDQSHPGHRPRLEAPEDVQVVARQMVLLAKLGVVTGVSIRRWRRRRPGMHRLGPSPGRATTAATATRR